VAITPRTRHTLLQIDHMNPYANEPSPSSASDESVLIWREMEHRGAFRGVFANRSEPSYA
jgi:hypothetical protein